MQLSIDKPKSAYFKLIEKAPLFAIALIMKNTWLNDAAPKQLFKDKELQLLLFDKRMKFLNNGITEHKITFSSSYFCFQFLPKQLLIEALIE